MGRFGDPLGALVRDGASTRRQGRARLPLGAPDARAVSRIQRCGVRHHRYPARPEIRPPTDYTKLLHRLAALWPSYLAYALTFLFIGQVWANHHVMFDHIRAAARVILLLNTLLLMIVAFLPFTTSVLAGALRSGHGLRTAAALYGLAFDATALTFNAVWQYARRHRLLSETLDPAGATAIGRRFQLALAWLTAGALLGLLLPFLGVAVIAAFNVFYWLPIRGESSRAPS